MSRRHLALAAAVRPPSKKSRSRHSTRGREPVAARHVEPLWTELEQAFFDSAPSENDVVQAVESFDDLDD
jgi:hypothetical protein